MFKAGARVFAVCVVLGQINRKCINIVCGHQRFAGETFNGPMICTNQLPGGNAHFVCITRDGHNVFDSAAGPGAIYAKHFPPVRVGQQCGEPHQNI